MPGIVKLYPGPYLMAIAVRSSKHRGLLMIILGSCPSNGQPGTAWTGGSFFFLVPIALLGLKAFQDETGVE